MMIRMIARRESPAALTPPARPIAIRFLTQKPRRQRHRRRPLADARRPGKQQCMGQAIGQTNAAQKPNRALLPHDVVKSN
jgi:hypothetical protein